MIQCFLDRFDARPAWLGLFQEEAEFVLGDVAEMPRPTPHRTTYVGTLKYGKSLGYWLMVLSTPFRGRANCSRDPGGYTPKDRGGSRPRFCMDEHCEAQADRGQGCCECRHLKLALLPGGKTTCKVSAPRVIAEKSTMMPPVIFE